MSSTTSPRPLRHRLFRSTALGLGAALALTGAVALPASAAPGDTSNATGQYLDGTLLALDATLVASLGGATATSDGTSTVTDGPDDLDVGALSLVNLSVPGGINLPVTFTDVGVVGQYAQARADGSSTGASGLITDSGGIGVAGTDGAQPGPLRLNLGEVVDSLTGLGDLTDQLAGLNLTIEATAATATQASPAAPVGDYEIAGADLSFTSPVLAGLTDSINGQVANVQTTLDALAGPDGSIAGALNALIGTLTAGLVQTTTTIGSADLPAAVAPLLTGSLTSPDYPGVAIDLSTGEVHVDLEQIVPLNDLPPNTNVLTHAFDHDNNPATPDATALDRIQQSITGLVGSLLTQVEAALTTATDNLAVNVSTSVGIPPLDVEVLGINSTIGALLDGDTSGITLLDIGLGLPGGLGAVVAALASPLGAVTAVIAGVSDAVLSPVLSDVVPAISPVLNAVVTLTANNQSTSGGVFTETALGATVLPGTEALTLNVANASVGPNAVAAVITSITPTEGPTTGGTAVTISGTGFTGATGVTFDGAAGTTFTVVNDTTITVTTPPGTAGPADVVVQSPSGDSQPGIFTYVAAPTISSLDPTSGPVEGGTAVTITGTGFTGTTAVAFDGTPATSFTVVSDTEITATSPAHPVGPVDVTVTTVGGTSAPGIFTYVAAPVVPTITSIAPVEGPETGGTVVTITGTGFTGTTAVQFDGVAGTALTVVSDTTITVTTPAHAPGPVDVTVLSLGGTSAPGTFTYLAAPDAPAITDLTPDEGPVAGGTVVTITGTGFTDATGVTFDGNAGTSFTVDSDTQITVTTPAGTAGAADVVVQSPNGDSDPGVFTYLAAPAITGLTPTEGPVAGGTVVTITGTGFTGATGVTFDGNAGTSFTVVSDTQITVTTPAGTAGAADVVVQSPNGDSGPGVFTYLAAPAITGLTPDEGPVAGGTVVTITGTGFTGATGVTFDGNAGTAFTVDSDTEITVTTPPGTAGVADVIVLSPNGDSAPGEFTYLAAPPVPTITGLTPTEGPEAGGTVVTITGTGFTGATGVTFDGNAGTSFTVVSDTEITVTTPAGTAGAADVVVESPNGDSDPGVFTYLAAPAITGLTPTEGPVAGGTVVTITGTGFTGATGVTFDGNAGTAFTVVSDTEIMVTTPAGTAGAADVVVESPNGDSDPGTFTYVAVPTISSIAPVEGPEAGGTVVTITGTGFTGATAVQFDGVSGTALSVDSDTQITVTTPAHAPGAVDVTVLTLGGTSDPGTFTFLAAPVPPAITGITPDEGPEAGGTVVTITGTGFTDATGVTFDGNAGTAFTVVSDTEITVTTPAGTAGAADVVIQSPNGDSDPGVFTYLAAPAITGLTPTEGPETGGTSVTITGTGFTGATSVTFDGSAATSFTVDSDTQITAVTPAHAPGAVDVVVTTLGGTSAPGAFTYTAVPDAPAITGLTPTSGPVAGGTVVTITGTGFTGAAGVTFDGTAGTAFTVDSDTQITVTTPAGTAGPADVVVLSPNGDSAPGEFTYVAGPAAPVISSLTPTSGPTAGGTTVTITGSGFTGATAVQFDGIAATSFTVDSDAQITAATPPHAAGPVDVTVMTLGGTSAPGTFTYVAPDAPVISGIAPDSGPVAGGTVVTITGTGFTDATGVTFDGTPGTSFTVVSDTEITVTTPPGTAGTADVVIQSPNGDSGPGVFTYVGAPVIDSITPDEGPIDGGTVVTIIGEDFTDATGVTFDGEPGTDFQVIDDNTIIVTTPPGTVGDADVIVQSPNGDSAPGVFTYVVAPTITSMDPTRGPTTGGTVVTIIGTGFLGNPSAGGVTLLATPTPGNPVVTFDGIAGTNVTVVSDTELRVTSPAHAVGTVPVVVMTTGGSSNPGDFTYYAAAATGGGDDLAVTGSDMAGMMLVGLFALLPLAAGIALLRRARRTAA